MKKRFGTRFEANYRSKALSFDFNARSSYMKINKIISINSGLPANFGLPPYRTIFGN